MLYAILAVLEIKVYAQFAPAYYVLSGHVIIVMVVLTLRKPVGSNIFLRSSRDLDHNH